MGKCVFSNLWLQKSLYKEWLREVKGDKHKARCIVCGMKDVDISSMGESAHKSLEVRKTSNTNTPEKVISKRSRFFWHFFSTTSNYKVVTKSASSESAEHMLNPTKPITASSSGSSVMEKSVTRDEMLKAEIFVGIESDNVSLLL